jgi:hypothetical protein
VFQIHNGQVSSHSVVHLNSPVKEDLWHLCGYIGNVLICDMKPFGCGIYHLSRAVLSVGIKNRVTQWTGVISTKVENNEDENDGHLQDT